jgi:hypothetical protein
LLSKALTHARLAGAGVTPTVSKPEREKKRKVEEKLPIGGSHWAARESEREELGWLGWIWAPGAAQLD